MKRADVNHNRLVIITILAIFFTVSFTSCTVITESPNQFPGYEREDLNTYFMKQKIWTLRDEFSVINKFGEPEFYIRGRFFSIGDKLRLYDREGKRLLYIKEQIFSFTRKYRIYRGREHYATIVKKIIPFRDVYSVKVRGKQVYTITGDFFNYRYKIFAGRDRVASISKKAFSFNDRYKIDIVRGEDDPLLIAAAVIIDMVNYHKEEARR